MKKQAAVGFADLAVKRRKIKREFIYQINKVVDWHLPSAIIDKHYVKGRRAGGASAPTFPGKGPTNICSCSLTGSWRRTGSSPGSEPS